MNDNWTIQGFALPGEPIWAGPSGESRLGAMRLRHLTQFPTTSQHNRALMLLPDLSRFPGRDVTLVLPPSGLGGFQLREPGGFTGVGKVGQYAVDLQLGPASSSWHTANGVGAFVAGYGSKADGPYSMVVAYIGQTNSSYAGVFAGLGCTAGAANSACVGGEYNQAAGPYSFATGQRAYSYLSGQVVQASGMFGTNGDAQRWTAVLRRALTSASPTALLLDGSSAKLVLPNHATWRVRIGVVARTSTAAGTVESASHERLALISRGANAASTTLVSSQTLGTDMASAGAAGWALTLSADTVGGALAVEYAAANGVRAVASVEVTEVVYA